MQHLGAFLADSSVPIPFNTRDAAGAPITLAGTPLLRVKRADTLAVIADDLAPTVDVGGVTGQHLLVVDTSPVGYDGLTEFIVDVKQGTVDGASVAGEILRGFSITTGVLPDNAISAGAVAAAAVTKVQNGLATAAALTTVDNELATIAGYIDTEVAALQTAVDALPDASANAAAVLASVVEGTVTLVQSLRLMNAILGGKASGLVASAASTPAFRDLADTKNRVTAVTDAAGNRTGVTLADLD